MIRTKNEQTVEFKCIRNGNGETEMRKILNGEEELYGKGRLFINEEFNDTYHKATYSTDDNGNIVKVHAGDTVICNDGEKHSLVNDGDVPLEAIALILYNK